MENAIDQTPMRDITVYELADGTLHNNGPGYGANPVPAVVGKTVADFENMKIERDHHVSENARLGKKVRTFARERNEARAEVEKLASDVKLMMPAVEKSERYREALERIKEEAQDAGYWRIEDLADEALGGGPHGE